MDDTELREAFERGWDADEAGESVHMAGLRAVAAAAWEEGQAADRMIRGVLRTEPTNPYVQPGSGEPNVAIRSVAIPEGCTCVWSDDGDRTRDLHCPVHGVRQFRVR